MAVLTLQLLTLKAGKFVVVMNGLNGHVEIFSTSFWEKFQESVRRHQLSKLDSGLVTGLKRRRLIWDSRCQEERWADEVRKSLEKRYLRTKVITVTVNFSEACNLACAYCFSRTRRDSRQMTQQHIDKIFSFLEEQQKRGHKLLSDEIWLFGGEPLREENCALVEYFFKKLAASGFKAAIITNGVTIDKYLTLLTKYRRLIRIFQITLDGPARVHDWRRIGVGYPKTFTIISRNINLLLTNGFKVVVRTNVDETNLAYLPQLATYMKRKGWLKKKNFRCYLAPVVDNRPLYCELSPLARNVKLIRRFRELSLNHPQLKIFSEKSLYNFPQKFLADVLGKERVKPKVAFCMSCGAKSFTFAADGKIYSCRNGVGIDAFRLGSYYPNLRWNRRNLKLWKYRLATRMTECLRCPLWFACGGNCTLAAYEQHGDVSAVACQRLRESLQEWVDLNKDKIADFVHQTHFKITL